MTTRKQRNPSRLRQLSDVPSLPMNADAKRVLSVFVASRGKIAERAIKARYDFSLMREWTDKYYGNRMFRFAINPKHGTETYSRWVAGYRRPKLDENEVAFAYRTPPNGMADVPEIAGMAYRGMSWEEWAFIRKHCTVRSRGEWNIDQDDLTFFGDASKAQSYAAGFAPWMFKPSKDRPSVVIAIPKRLTLDHTDLPGLIPNGELAIRGGISASMITHAWRIVPTLIHGGYRDIMLQSSARGTIDVKDGSQPDVQEYVVVPSSLRELSRCAAVENPSRRR